MFKHYSACFIVAAGIIFSAGIARAAIIFDDFNVSEGHFSVAPTFSSTSTVLATSTADRTTAAGEVYEGSGAEKLVLKAPAATPVRCRFLSNSGSPTGQPSFTVSSATTDGYIGFFYKVIGAASGLQFGMNLDAPANTGATMVGGILKTAVADGNWHVVEWNLDALSDWGAVSGIGGAQGNLQLAADNPHTIDSIYFYNMAVNSTTTVLVDFVAKSDSGTIAALVPEPASLGLLALLVPGLLRRRH